MKTPKEKKRVVEKAKSVIAKIFDLTLDAQEHGVAQSSLTKATDAMYDFIKEIESL